jgi:hypothetical protein
MNPFQAMQAFQNPQGMLKQQLQAKMNQMATENPALFAKMQQMTNGKNEAELKQVAQNLAKERGIDLQSFAKGFGISI